MPIEQAGATSAGQAKQQRLVLARESCKRDPDRSREAAEASPRPRNMLARRRQVTRSSKGLSSPEELAGATSAGHGKQQRLVLAQGASRRDPGMSREVAKACPRPRNKQARPRLVTRSSKGLSSPEEQAGKTPACHVKQERLVLARRTSRRDLSWSREAAMAYSRPRNK